MFKHNFVDKASKNVLLLLSLSLILNWINAQTHKGWERTQIILLSKVDIEITDPSFRLH